MPIFHYQKPKPVFSGTYKKSDLTMPSGAVFDAPLASNASSAETGQTITTSGNVTYNTVDGIPCAYFDGNATIYMPDNDENILRLPRGNMPGTISLWFKSTAAQYASIMNYCGEQRTARGIWLTNSGNITLNDGNDSLSDTVGFCDDVNHFNGNWCHALITYNGTTLKLYIDGIEKSSVDYELNTEAIRFGIGAWAWGHITHYYTGYVAAVRLYDRVVTAEELLTLSKEFIPSLLYPTSTGFDEMGFAVPYDMASDAGCDRSMIPKDGLVFYAPLIKSTSAAETGQTLKVTGNVFYGENGATFDGSSYITTDAGLTDLRTGTFHCKFNRSSNSGDTQTIFCMSEYDGASEMVAYINAYSELLLTNGRVDLGTSVTVENGREYMLTVTYNGETASCYVDGELVSDGSLYTSPVSSTLRIGAWIHSVTRCFVGVISSMCVWDRILTDEEIQRFAKEIPE